jgi:hypothetical protein
MPKIPPPITELEFKEAIRDCFNQDTHGEISEWSAFRGWEDRSSGSRALNWKEPQKNNLYEGYRDIYAARQVSIGLATRLWDKFSRAVYPLIRPEHHPAESSPLAEIDLYYNNWKCLEHAREDGYASREECEAARKRALESLTKFKAEEMNGSKRPVYARASHIDNGGKD